MAQPDVTGGRDSRRRGGAPIEIEPADQSQEMSVEITSALFAEDLVVRYPTATTPAVDCRRIDLPEEAITALVGPNGSGKSTLLKTLSKHLEPESGEIVLDGRNLHDYGGKELAQRLGHLSQENYSPENVTVEELVFHGRYPHRGFLESLSETDRTAVDRAIELAGVEALREKELGQLSGGQKQLVWIAMVLAQDTEVLLLDEPTTFLDLNHQLRVMETVRRLNANERATVAVVLHDIAQATRYADYLIALKDGSVYDWGPPADVVTEQFLAEVFEVEATVEHDASGGPTVHPQRPLRDEAG